MMFQWLLVHVSINDANARVCSDHFIREGYIQRKQYSYFHDMVEDVIKLQLSGSQQDISQTREYCMIPKN